jgi:hypothetical protein
MRHVAQEPVQKRPPGVAERGDSARTRLISQGMAVLSDHSFERLKRRELACWGYCEPPEFAF